MMEDSWRDVAKKKAKLLEQAVYLKILGDVIAVWQKFWDELVAASHENKVCVCVVCECNHSNLCGSTLKNNFVIIIISTLNVVLI